MKYPKVALTPEQAAAMRAHQDKVMGLQRAMAMFVENGERRGAQLQQEGRELYEGIAKVHGLDLERVQYVPSRDGNELVPVMVKVNEDPSNGAG